MNEIIGRMVAAMKATGLDVVGWDDETVAELAAAALRAIREPTIGMYHAVQNNPQYQGESRYVSWCRGWNDAIDVALAEKPSAT